MIFLFGSSGKIGNYLLPYLERETRIWTKYDKSIKGKKVTLIFSIYSKNIISIILFLIKIRRLINNNKSIIIYELCSISQLSDIKNLMLYPKIIPYYIIRNLQSILFSLFLSSSNVKEYKRLFIGKAISKNTQSEHTETFELEIDIEKLGEYIYNNNLQLRKNNYKLIRRRSNIILISKYFTNSFYSFKSKEYEFIKAVLNVQKRKQIDKVVLN